MAADRLRPTLEAAEPVRACRAAGREPVLDQAEQALQHRPPPPADVGADVGMLEVGAGLRVGRGRLDHDGDDALGDFAGRLDVVARADDRQVVRQRFIPR
jgi:hypothetical protein